MANPRFCVIVDVADIVCVTSGRCPGHHINPKRVNGSAVETLFGQLKHGTGGNLTGSSYGTAKATMLTKRMVHGGRKTDGDYRNAPLNVRQMELKRKRCKF